MRVELPPTPLTHPRRDELEIDLDPIPIAALPLPGSPPPAGDTPPPDPPAPPPDTPPHPPPMQPLIESERRRKKALKKLPPIVSPLRGGKKKLPPFPPRVTRQSSKEIEMIKRVGDIPDAELPAPSPSRKRSQPEGDILPLILRETRRRISEPAEEDELPATPSRGRRTRSIDAPHTGRKSSEARKNLPPLTRRITL